MSGSGRQLGAVNLVEAWDSVTLDKSLSDAKSSVPPHPRPGLVSRGEMIQEARSGGWRVVGVTAPAGYGKSTLLAEWARTEDRRVVWASLDRYDDEPAVLLALLASAYARVFPGHAGLVADMAGLGVSTLGRAAPRLASALHASPVPFVLILDDLHELRSPTCHDVLGVVISGIPPGSQLVAASRSEQPHLPRLRASGEAMELLASDLALDSAGAEQIFAQAQVSVTHEQAAELTERTEGWAAGLYLAAMIARNSHARTLTVSGDDRFVADYLYRESLMQVPKKTQRFLRRTSILEQLSAPLCDALLGDTDGTQRLRDLEGASLFLIPLDRRREWYRYHPLFREFLFAELRRVEPDIITKLHLRAADWYEANGSPGRALEHLLHTTDRDRCVRLTTALILPTYQAGQISTVERWLSALGDDAVEQHPPLAVLAGWIAALTGRTVEAQRWGAFLDTASYSGAPLDGSASFESARAMLRAIMCPAGIDQMMADTSLAVEQEPPWSPWRDVAVALRAEALLLSGDTENARVMFTEASAVAAALGNPDVQALTESELAVLALDEGRWADAAAHVESALTAVAKNRRYDYATSVLAFAAAARLALHHGDLDEAENQLTRAMRARPTVTFVLPSLAVRIRLQLATVCWHRGNLAAARHLMREVDDILLHRPHLGTLLAQVSEFRQTMTRASSTGYSGGAPLSQAELRLLPYLQTHLTIAKIGERLFITYNTASTEVASIYRKLGVSSRNEAVKKAIAIGLLGE